MSLFSNYNNICIALITGLIIIVVYLSKQFLIKKSVKKPNKSVNKVKPQTKVKETVTKAKKKSSVNERWLNRDTKKSYSHPWLITSFKGHTGEVLDIDYSSNGKYLASCSEDALDPGGDTATTSSGSESTTKPLKLTRRQRKNRRPRSIDNSNTIVSSSSSTTSSPDIKRKSKKMKAAKIGRSEPNTMLVYPPLRNHTKMHLSEARLENYLRCYLLPPDQLFSLGYPVESTVFPNHAVIYKNSLMFQPKPISSATTQFDVNAREFVPGVVRDQVMYVNRNDNLPPIRTWCVQEIDSGQGSGTSSPVSMDSENSDDLDTYMMSNESEERKCVRCGRGFIIGPQGQYLTQEHCTYHWGKLHRVQVPRVHYEFTCCQAGYGSVGCTTCKQHVWNGLNTGINGPIDGFVRTVKREVNTGCYGVYALDCEMCYTKNGLELTKITVVGSDGRLIYDSFVKPDNEIIDYNTRFSGITARDFCKKNGAKTLKDVQMDLLNFISADTILIGHGLENDLRALHLLHSTVIDTSVTFPHYYGLPYKRSLKSLTSSLLKRDIQCDTVLGHNSVDDARACMELMLWRVRKDFKYELNRL